MFNFTKRSNFMSKRLFIAIKPGKDVLDSIIKFQADLKNQLPYRGIRWVRPELTHLTMLFLGDVEETLIPDIAASLNSAAEENEAYNLSFKGAGFFGRPDQLRNFWISSQDTGETQNLYRSVCNSIQGMITIDKKRLTPHLTLARVSDYVSKEQKAMIAETINKHKDMAFGSSRIESFDLIESTLTPAGPIYKTLKQFFLR